MGIFDILINTCIMLNTSIFCILVFQDVHVMIFIGFGFLMTFLQKYGFSSIGLNFLIACFTIELAIVASGFRSKVLHDEEFRIGIVR